MNRAFIKYTPYGDKTPSDLWTTSDRDVQLWQELTMLRHTTGWLAINEPVSTAAYLDQAKVYFLDAAKSNWRSSGLLYYYSFLNLAKAHLITNQVIGSGVMKSTNIYHGLHNSPQSPEKFVDFKLEIHPPSFNRNTNIFSEFYQSLTHEKWPFTTPISVKLSDILPYCDDISHEVKCFYNIDRESSDVLSLIRNDDKNVWFEILVHDSKIISIKNELGSQISQIIEFNRFTNEDKEDWLKAHGRSALSLKDFSIIKFCEQPFQVKDLGEKYNKLFTESVNLFKGYILPFPFHNYDLAQNWLFIPKINLNSTPIKWHPLLSNYLFAFVLSSVLRYQPHLFISDTKDSFLAEAWCNQSASSTLRYFLMEFSKQNIRIN